MRLLARGPNLVGIDGKPIAAGRRIEEGSMAIRCNEATA